jgi:hypothetical protein
MYKCKYYLHLKSAHIRPNNSAEDASKHSAYIA